ncbi:MAG: DUF6311 domain-containing protein [Lachnospiraceae bacterium]|nr:DUF6311 domain-containing protein [Lachnospiraceae bacterium]
MKENNAFLARINGKKLIEILVPILVGICAFLSIYGLAPLNVFNDQWILSGYDESDIIQHYAGWLAYRKSEWSFPLGMAKDLAVGTGTIISFTDSIPLIAILFKIFRNYLPATFQYFGIYTLLCFVLQSIAAFKTIKFMTKNSIYSIIATILFTFAPIFMERAFRHTALGSQWLIIFSIYLYLKHSKLQRHTTYVKYLFLEIMAIGIHPYFLPMVAVFAFLCVVNDIKINKYISIIYLVGIQVVTFLAGILLGALGSGVNISRDGYGYFSMNINALINPTSLGQYEWSTILKVHPQILGNYDGFNYLGFGVIVFGIVVIILAFLLRQHRYLLQVIRQHIYLIVVCLGLTCFAISNVITYNDIILGEIPLPDLLLSLCGMFRASSRLFYPVYYIIYLFLIIFLWKILENQNIYAYGILVFIVVLQILDLHECIIQKHTAMNEKKFYTSYVDADLKLRDVASNADYLLLDEYYGDINMMRTLAVWGAKNDISLFFSIANSGSYDEMINLANEILYNIKDEKNLGKNIIVTTKKEVADFYKQYINCRIYEVDGNYFLY